MSKLKKGADFIKESLEHFKKNRKKMTKQDKIDEVLVVGTGPAIVGTTVGVALHKKEKNKRENNKDLEPGNSNSRRARQEGK